MDAEGNRHDSFSRHPKACAWGCWKTASCASQEGQTHVVCFQCWRQHQAGCTIGLAPKDSSYICQTLHKPVPGVACSISAQTAHNEGFISSDLPAWTFYWAHSTHGLASKHPVPISQALYQAFSLISFQKPGEFNWTHAKWYAKIALNKSGLIMGREKRNLITYTGSHK